MFRVTITSFGVLVCCLLAGCPTGSETRIDDEGASASGFDWRVPAWVPLPVEPADNAMSEEKFQLGRHLFYDTRLSGGGNISCGSCHHQDKAFTDALPRSFGSTGEQHPRNAQPLTNVAWMTTLTWANPSLATLEQQIVVPLFGDRPIEHGINESNHHIILAVIRNDPVYQRLFRAAFPEFPNALQGEDAWNHIVAGLASFVRGLVSFDSAFDRYSAGQITAMNESARRGMQLFNGERLECFHCHEGYNFTNSTRDRSMTVVERPFHNTGLYNIDGRGGYPEENTGVYEVSGRDFEMGAFRAPSLRNIALTAPYMHDGTIASLEEVVRTYAAGGRNVTEGQFVGDGRTNPLKDSFIAGFEISESEIQDVIAFLESLTDESFVTNPRFANPWESM